MHLNDRPCWLQVNRCGRTNGLPAPRPPVLEATRWETHTQAEMRSSDVEKYRNLVVSLYSLTFGFAIVYSWYLCLRPPGGSRGRDIELIWWRKTPGLALSISRSVQAIRANIHVEIIVTFVCKSTLYVLSLYPASIPLNPPLWMRKQPRISSSNY